jgi:eukaryotic-like serine/threonine-protein kinase
MTKSSNFSIGDIINCKFLLVERIGQGGMGAVYRAHQLNLNRDVAIKLISEDLLQGLDESTDAVESTFGRFQREVKTMAKVRHPNVLQIYDHGSVSMQCDDHETPLEYISMEYIPGNTLRFTMSDYGFEDEEDLLEQWLRGYFMPVLDGVEAIHHHGIVHRDIKPENILMDGEIPKIADFGLARATQMRAVSNSWDVKGTWPYMAPEQFADFRKAGPEADIYALGKILYEAVSGKMDPRQVPFIQVGLADPQTAMLKTLDGVIRKATCSNKEERYKNVDELRRAVQAVLEQKISQNKPIIGQTPVLFRWMWAGIITTLLALAGMTAYHIWEAMHAPAINQRLVVESPPSPEAPQNHLSAEPTLLSADGRTMLLIDAPQLDGSFYSDPALVTFHHFVDFLNETPDELTVSEGVVQKDGEVWIYLGDGGAPYEQIIYQNERFRLRNAEWAARPVVRVTWFGAQAYARFYNQKLPDFDQWQALVAHHAETASIENHASANLQQGAMEGTGHAMSNAWDAFDADQVGKEWLADGVTEGAYPIVVAPSPAEETSASLLRRHPWEGFPDVGFRTIVETGRS